MDETLISVIIPVYNTELYLDQCLNSVINQTYKNIEIICVNDGSTDKSLEILEDYAIKDKRIKIINKTNGGISSARNIGMNMAIGEYVYFLDSDDWICINLLEKALQKIKEDNSDFVIFDVCNVYKNNAIIEVKRLDSFIKKYNITKFKYNDFKDIAYQNCAAWNKLFRKSFIVKYSLFFDIELKQSEDFAFWFCLLYTNPQISILNESCYFYRKSNNSMSTLTFDLLDRLNDTFAKFKEYEIYKNTSIDNRLIAFDYFTQMVIYSYSSINSLSYIVPFEKNLKFIFNEYKCIKNSNLWKFRGYKLLKFRFIYIIGKKIILTYKLWRLKHATKNIYNYTCL